MVRSPLFPEIDVMLHEPARLRVVALLAVVDEADFMYLLRKTGLSRGNLSVQMKKLEAAGIVTVAKELNGNRPRTSYALSGRGRESLEAYATAMQLLLGSISGQSESK